MQDFVLPPEAAVEEAAAPVCKTPPTLPRLTPRRFAATLRRHWFGTVAFAALGGLVIGLVLWTAIPVETTAETVLEIQPPGPAVNTGKLPHAEARTLRSAAVLRAALRRPEVAALPAFQGLADPLRYLEKRLTVDDSRPETLRVGVCATRPSEAALLLHGVVRSFLEELGRQRAAELEQLRQAHARGTRQLRELNDRLAGADNPRGPGPEKDLQEAQFELHRARLDLVLQESLEKSIDSLPAPESAVRAAVKGDAAGGALLQEVARLEGYMRDVEQASALGARDPNWQVYSRQRAELLEKINRLRAELLPAVERQVREKARAELAPRLKALRERVATLKERTRTLQAAVQRQGHAEVDKGRQLRDELAAAVAAQHQREAEIQQAEKAVAAVAAAWGGEDQTVLGHDGGARAWTAGLAGSGTFALLLVGLTCFDVRRWQVGAAADVADEAGLAVVAHIPVVAPRALAVGGAPLHGRLAARQAQLHEAVDALRTVLLRGPSRGARVIMITSAGPGEGKTTLAAQLAASLARAWRKTLLLDANLRQPAVHTHHGLHLEPGLAEVLRGECELADAIQPTAESRLSVLTAGHADAHAIGALAQETAGALFAQLGQQCDFVVLDAAPVLPVADALVLSQYADRLLLAVRCGVSRIRSVAAACQRLAPLDVPLLGAVVIGTESPAGADGYAVDRKR
jgi:capsular exopolysaccharide synthesis family protein